MFIYRRLLLAVALPAALATLSAAPVASADTGHCYVLNTRTYAKYFTTLQAGVNGASAGDTLDVQGTCYGDTVIDIPLTIIGSNPQPTGGSATLDGAGAGSVVTVDPGINLGLHNLLITGGAGGPGATDSYGGGFTVGGGIDNAGVLRLDETTVSGNSASAGGGIFNESGQPLTLAGSFVSGNTATDPTAGGGGIWNDYGTVTFACDRQYPFICISHNTAAGSGGGIANNGGSVSGYGVEHNSAAADGGGIYVNTNASVTVPFPTAVSGNTATATGRAGGGGIFDLGQLTNYGNVSGNTGGNIER